MADGREKTGVKDIKSRLDNHERPHAKVQNAERYYEFFGGCSRWK